MVEMEEVVAEPVTPEEKAAASLATVHAKQIEEEQAAITAEGERLKQVRACYTACVRVRVCVRATYYQRC